jgi:hypothetical protein
MACRPKWCASAFGIYCDTHAAAASKDRSFKQWILDNLGEGMAKHFMVPFNEKLWQVSLDELTSDWVSWLVPKPELKDVVNGALGIKDKAFGYNPSFQYPATDGIRVLPESFLPGIASVHNGMELVEVDTKRRRALFRNLRNGEAATNIMSQWSRRFPFRNFHDAASTCRRI